MKKVFLLLLIACLSACSSGDSDNTKLEKHFADYYSISYKQDELSWNVYESRSTMPDTEKAYTIYYSFSSPDGSFSISKNGSGWGGNLTNITADYTKLGLRNNKTLTLNVHLSNSDSFSGNYEWKLEFSKYTDYFSEILRPKFYSSYVDCMTGDKNGESYVQISGSRGSNSGMIYYHTTWTVRFNEGTFEYNTGSYQKYSDGTRYNEENRSIMYYFNCGSPRIEGLSFGTYYIGDYFNSTDTTDTFVYEHVVTLNNIFKEMNDTEYMTRIS